MYNVMLVDDEILVRERISKRIPWEELGYCLAAVCENGKEAIEALKTEDIDLVLTDICMPYADGLDVAKYVYEEKKGTKVILLSGYDEFSYAKQAVEYQALSYVLKPVTAAELVETLTEARGKLDERKEEDRVKSRYLGSLGFFKGQILMQLALGNLTEEVFQEKCKEYGIVFEGERYCAVAAYPKGQLPELALPEILEWVGSASADALAFEGADRNLVIFVRGCNNKRLSEEARKLCQELAGYVNQRFQRQFCCFIGNCVPNLLEIDISYQKALGLKEFMYLEKETYLYEWEFFQKHKWDVRRGIMDKEREARIVLAVKSNLKNEIKNELDAIQRECQETWVAKNRAILLFQSLVFAVMASVSQANLEGEEALFQKEQECMMALFQCAYLTEMHEIAFRFLGEAADLMNDSRANYGERQAAMALAYIEKHYADPELSLASLCQKLAISVSYFSTAFKEYTGKTFVEALTEQRMGQARALLESQPLKMYEIANKCGYKDSNYFSATFKKWYGTTPREYVKSMKEDGTG